MPSTTTRTASLVPMVGGTLGHPMDTKNRRWATTEAPSARPSLPSRRRRAGISAAVVVAAALAALPAAAGASGGGPCPPGYELTGTTAGTASFDKDLNGVVCVNPATGQVKDDHIGKRRRV